MEHQPHSAAHSNTPIPPSPPNIPQSKIQNLSEIGDEGALIPQTLPQNLLQCCVLPCEILRNLGLSFCGQQKGPNTQILHLKLPDISEGCWHLAKMENKPFECLCPSHQETKSVQVIFDCAKHNAFCASCAGISFFLNSNRKTTKQNMQTRQIFSSSRSTLASHQIL